MVLSSIAHSDSIFNLFCVILLFASYFYFLFCSVAFCVLFLLLILFLFSVAVCGLNSLRCFLILMLCKFYVSDYVLEGSEGTPFAGLLAMLLIQYMMQKIVWLSCSVKNVVSLVLLF
jgi:hypothetical protein